MLGIGYDGSSGTWGVTVHKGFYFGMMGGRRGLGGYSIIMAGARDTLGLWMRGKV